MSADSEDDYQREQCGVAARLYAGSMSPPAMAQGWLEATTAAATAVAHTLRRSEYLADIAGALRAGGKHVLVLRQMLAPPLSQDQFAIFCKAYSKSAENGDRPFSAERAEKVVKAVLVD